MTQRPAVFFDRDGVVNLSRVLATSCLGRISISHQASSLRYACANPEATPRYS